MTIRTDEHGVRRGNAADAGRVCKTDKRPNGVLDSSYRRMVSQLGAPGPIRGSVNPTTGEVEYDLDEVERWHTTQRKRPGDWHHDITHRTPMRHEVLAQIVEGRFTVLIEKMQVRVHRDGKPFEGRANTRQFTDLQRAEMIAVPERGGEVKATDAGRALLATWNRETEPTQAEPAQAG